MCVVAPGYQPRTKAEKRLCTSSGHIISLMPGDDDYSPNEFPVVIAWNGINHYVPTYLINHKSILHHQIAVVTQGMRNVCSLFEDLEDDLDSCSDEDLIEHMHILRDNTVFGMQLMADRGNTTADIPPNTQGPHPDDVRDHLTRKTPIPIHPIPFYGKLAEEVLDPECVGLSRLVINSVSFPQPPIQALQQHDFIIDPNDYHPKTFCTNPLRSTEPEKLHIFEQRFIQAVPLDPTKANPKAARKSIGARRFRETINESLKSPEANVRDTDDEQICPEEDVLVTHNGDNQTTMSPLEVS